VKKQVEKWLTKQVPNWKEKQFLLAVSGGRDSVALAAVFSELGVQFSIAHCNYQLRGEDSNNDEQFVKALAKKCEVICFVEHFETQEILDTRGGNLQETARDLRYNWFNELVKNENLDFIAVGTQLNDSAETLLMNLMRGAGLAGLRGILPVRENIVRPFIETSRTEIDAYINSNDLKFREDKSNASNKYERNRWRNEIIPQLKEQYPHFDSALKSSIAHLQIANELVQKETLKISKHLLVQQDNKWLINRGFLANLNPKSYYLYEGLKPFGFNATTINDLCDSDLKQSGKQYFSSTHVITVDRDYLIVEALKTRKRAIQNTREILFSDESITQPTRLKFALLNVPIQIKKKPHLAYLDADKLTFPLTLRKWMPGDRFRPFGMLGMKKLSDFLIDIKMPLPNKEQQMVLLSGNNIIWVVGQRIDDRFAVTDSTKKIYFVEQKQAT
tara:strand:+ start:15283 stop:16617 length:1335 start_codon:yes stop_codon:yes gene_type:complete